MLHVLGIEGCGPVGGAVGARFSRQLAQRILGRTELLRPVFVVAEFIEKPVSDTVLFLWRQAGQLRDRCVQGLGHKGKYNRTERAAQQALVFAG